MKPKTVFLSLLSGMLLSFSSLSLSEEPTFVQELVGLRNDHTRVWEYTRQVQVTNERTGLTEQVTVRSEVYEKADNLCYNRSTTKTPDWTPTVEAITLTSDTDLVYQAAQGAYQVGITSDLTQPWSVVYQVEKQQLQLGIRYLGYYDTSNNHTVILATTASVVPKLNSPNKLYYSNVFPGVDIEYVYTKGKFLQNAIIQSLASYQSPSYYAMNPESTQLFVATELDLSDSTAWSLSVNKQPYRGAFLSAEEKYPIIVNNRLTGKRLCSFEPNQAFDTNAEQRKEALVHQKLIAINGKHYLLEGIPVN